MEIIELNSIDEIIQQTKEYLDEGCFFSEERFYYLEAQGSEGIEGDLENNGFIKNNNLNIFYELGAVFLTHSFRNINLQNFMDTIIDKFEKIDPSSFYTYTLQGSKATIFCNNSYFSINPQPDYGAVLMNNLSGISFDSDQKDLSLKENQNNKNIINLGTFIEEYFEENSLI